MNNSRYFGNWRRSAPLPLTLISLFTLLISLALSTPALADPPGRIGRVSWLSEPGSLTLGNRSGGESFRAPLNQPLTSGDVLRTEANTRAEIQIGSMTLRLDENTALELSRIDDERVSVLLRNGGSIARLTSRESAREFALNTENGRFTSGDPGIFRVEADGNGSAATAYDGTLHFTANDADIDIETGERANIWYAGQTHYRLTTPASDDFMRWSAARDQRPLANTASASSRYVSPEMTGAEDLDAYGDWSDTPDYGPVWMPRSVAIDWAPYRTGHWAWVAPWGWSWVGHEPWGFAPFHYGRWVQYRGRWGWVPGTRIARPVYTPAMVAWSSEPGFSDSFTFGRPPMAGWFPLAPREVYVPFYRSSPDYVRRVNRTHVNHIENLNVIVSNPHDFGRHARYVHRDMRRFTPEKPFVHALPAQKHSPSSPQVRKPHRGDYDGQRDDRHREARDGRHDRQRDARQQANSSPPYNFRHPDTAFIQLAQPTRSAKPTHGEAREQERRPDARRRTSIDEDPRKRRRHEEAGERR